MTLVGSMCLKNSIHAIGVHMKTSFTVRLLASVVLSSLALLPSARAAQIASNINGADIGIRGINEGFWSGVKFTTDPNPWTVDNVVAPVSQSVGRSLSGIFIQVYTNVGGQPGSPLGSKMITPTIS